MCVFESQVSVKPKLIIDNVTAPSCQAGLPPGLSMRLSWTNKLQSTYGIRKSVSSVTLHVYVAWNGSDKAFVFSFTITICAVTPLGSCINMAGRQRFVSGGSELLVHQRIVRWDVHTTGLSKVLCNPSIWIWTCLISLSFHPACPCRLCPASLFRAPCCLSPRGSTNASREAFWAKAWTLNAPPLSSSSSGPRATSNSGSSARGKRMTATTLSSPGDRGGKKKPRQVGSYVLTSFKTSSCSALVVAMINCHTCSFSNIISLSRFFMGSPTWRAAA